MDEKINLFFILSYVLASHFIVLRLFGMGKLLILKYKYIEFYNSSKVKTVLIFQFAKIKTELEGRFLLFESFYSPPKTLTNNIIPNKNNAMPEIRRISAI